MHSRSLRISDETFLLTEIRTSFAVVLLCSDRLKNLAFTPFWQRLSLKTFSNISSYFFFVLVAVGWVGGERESRKN